MIGRSALGERLLAQFGREDREGWRIVDNDALLHKIISEHERPQIKKGLQLSVFAKNLKIPDPGEGNGRGVKKRSTEEDDGQADLIVDVSGDVSVRWMLSSKNVARCASMFFSPAGDDGVLLLEDWGRRSRLDRIEPQFYRWLINGDPARDAGEVYMDGGSDRDRGDISARLSPDALDRHAGALRHGLLSAVHGQGPALMVFRRDENGGYTPVHGATPHSSLYQNICGWRIVWDRGVETKVLEMRWKKIPLETGGAILGYADRDSKSIFVVDVCPEPNDSSFRGALFQRGSRGVSEAVETARRRTGNMVNYIGEWRSHPNAMFTVPGMDDLKQLAHARDEMAVTDHPAVILIIGENDLMFHVMFP